MIKVLMFDFDGVLVDSNNIKRDAFWYMFDENSKLRDVMRGFVDKNPEATRYEKLNWLFDTLSKPEEEREAFVKKYSDQYNTIIQKGILEKGIFEGAQDMLKQLSEKYPLYISTGTPMKSIEQTLNTLGIRHYFKDIYAKPMTKVESTREILNIHNVQAQEILIVGDGPSDLNAARETGCWFIGIRNDFNGWGSDEVFDTIGHISELPAALFL